MSPARTRLESEGAEHLVLGHLLIEGIGPSFQTFTNWPGYDIVAADPETGRSCRIQVKARRHTGNRGFPISRLDADFVVFVQLRRGLPGGRVRPNGDDGRGDPIYYVLPIAAVAAAHRPGKTWSKCRLGDMENPEQYRDAWSLIRNHLADAAP